MGHYLSNFLPADSSKEPAPREQVAELMRVKMWSVDADERHRDALAPGDLILSTLRHGIEG